MARLYLIIHAYACEAAAATGHWEEVEHHAQLGLARARRMQAGRGAREQWTELWFSHAALATASRRGAAISGRSGASTDDAATASSLAASRRTLLRQLCEYCHRRASMGSTPAPRRSCGLWWASPPPWALAPSSIGSTSSAR